jgi:hypothetical protein
VGKDIGYNGALMNNKTNFIIQLIGLAFLFAAVIMQVLMFLNVSARMTAIEQKQGVLERHMDVLQDAQINSSINYSWRNWQPEMTRTFKRKS